MCTKRRICLVHLMLAGLIFLVACQAEPLERTPTLSPTASLTPVVPPTLTATPEIPEADMIETEMARLNPAAQGYVALTYDAESDRVILFGGQVGDASDVIDETWAFDPSTNQWSRMNPADSPFARGAGQMAYDAESDRVILFGGYSGSLRSDTWAYDFNTDTWTELSEGPVVGIGAQMDYDAESDRIILFGGWSGSFQNSTWAYDFNTDTWTEMLPDTPPPGRNFHVMTYDPTVDRIIVWGGDVEGSADLNIWSYDYNSNTWEERIPEGENPPGREYSALAYASEVDRSILYGGADKGLTQTWGYDYAGNTWTEIETEENPGRLSRHAMVYVPSTGQIILFGGQIGESLYGSIQLSYTRNAWSYDPAANTWADLTSYP